MSGHGGARPGAGRRRVQLADLVAEKRFDWRNPRHRRALKEDVGFVVPEDHPKAQALATYIDAYRRSPFPSSRTSLARSIQAMVLK